MTVLLQIKQLCKIPCFTKFKVKNTMAQRGATKGNMNRKGKLAKTAMDVAERIAAMGCDPFESMVRIAQQAEESGDLGIAAMLHKELAQYCAPKRKAIEITGELNADMTINVITGIER